MPLNLNLFIDLCFLAVSHKAIDYCLVKIKIIFSVNHLVFQITMKSVLKVKEKVA